MSSINKKTKISYAIGDIHGCYDYLLGMEKLIQNDLAFKYQYGTIAFDAEYEVEIIFLGDYIDRGDKSFQVIERLMGYNKIPVTFLRGNHEAMYIEALDAKKTTSSSFDMWYINGGKECSDSYPQENMSQYVEKHLNFFKSMPHWYEDINAFYVHAGLTSLMHPSKHAREHLIWSRNRDFLAGNYCTKGLEQRGINKNINPNGKPVVVGHTPVKKIGRAAGGFCINVDGGSTWAKRLCCVVLDSRGREDYLVYKGLGCRM